MYDFVVKLSTFKWFCFIYSCSCQVIYICYLTQCQAISISQKLLLLPLKIQNPDPFKTWSEACEVHVSWSHIYKVQDW